MDMLGMHVRLQSARQRTGVPAASSMADSPKAVPTHSVCTSGLMYFMVS